MYRGFFSDRKRVDCGIMEYMVAGTQGCRFVLYVFKTAVIVFREGGIITYHLLTGICGNSSALPALIGIFKDLTAAVGNFGYKPYSPVTAAV